MFDIGWTELLLIGIVALIVVGPKDLPVMFRQLGRFTGKMKRMAREFQSAMDAAADETGVKDVASGLDKDIRKATSPKNMGMDALKDAADRFEKWDPSRPPKPQGDKLSPGKRSDGSATSETQRLAESRAASAAEARKAAADRAADRAAARTGAGAGAETAGTAAGTGGVDADAAKPARTGAGGAAARGGAASEPDA